MHNHAQERPEAPAAAGNSPVQPRAAELAHSAAGQIALLTVERTEAAVPLDVAYAAGFFDGEGCIHIARDRSRGSRVRNVRVQYLLHVVVSQNDRRPLDWLCERWNGGVFVVREAQGNWAKAHAWRAVGPTAGRFLADVRPYLQVKAAVADNALEFLAAKTRRSSFGIAGTSPEILAEYDVYYQRHRELVGRIRPRPAPDSS
jgi:hypothetical protein